MSEKLPVFDPPPAQVRAPCCRRSKRRRILPVLLLAIIGLIYLTPLDPTVARLRHLAQDKLQPSHYSTSRIEDVTKVPLEAHIMSKCPDARDCLREMIVPAMEQIEDLVDFRLSIIGKLDPEDDSVHCMHGPSECLGDSLILCAQSLYGNSTIRSLGFANCLIGDYKQIATRAHVENCALEYGISFEDLNDCVSDSGRGSELLRKSAEWSQSEGVMFSCTVRIAGETWCVRDDGEWKDCEGGSEVKDLVAKVKTLAKDSTQKLAT